MSSKRFHDFMRGFAAASQLMYRAGDNGCFVEYVCLTTSVIDALLRTGLVLRHQLDFHTNEIPIELIYQADDDKIISERNIYKKALEKSIISYKQYDKLEELYKQRNKIVHRYIISEITTDEVLQIAIEYQQIIDLVKDKVSKLEEYQIEKNIGITVARNQAPKVVRAQVNEQMQEMIGKKHGHPGLAEKMKSKIRGKK